MPEPPEPLEEGVCKSCRQPILWVRMRSTDKMMPVDTHPHKNLVVLSQSGRGMVASVAYVSHFATCPNSKQHRKKRT